MKLQEKIDLINALQIGTAQIREGLFEIENIMKRTKEEIWDESNEQNRPDSEPAEDC